MITVTIEKNGTTIETKEFAMVTGFCGWMEVTGYGWLDDGCTLTISKALPTPKEQANV